MSNNIDQSIVSYDEGWDYTQKGIKKLLQGLPNPHFTPEDCLMLYTNVYNMCTQNPPYGYSYEMYENYKKTFNDYIKSTVLPSLREKKDEPLLRDLLKRWSNNKIMIKYLSKFFYCLEIKKFPSLEEAGYLSFYSLVCDDEMMKRQVKNAILAMIHRKHAGESIDEKLVHNVLKLYSEIGEKLDKKELKHFAETIIKENAIM